MSLYHSIAFVRIVRRREVGVDIVRECLPGVMLVVLAYADLTAEMLLIVFPPSTE